jgi:hypothetical protein
MRISIPQQHRRQCRRLGQPKQLITDAPNAPEEAGINAVVPAEPDESAAGLAAGEDCCCTVTRERQQLGAAKAQSCAQQKIGPAQIAAA